MPHSGSAFVDVAKGGKLSADNMNAVHAAVRELQQVQPGIRVFLLEPARIDPANVATARPDCDDGAIGTAIVNEGTATTHFVEIDASNRKVKELSSEMQKKFSNAGQKFFSRDEVFLIGEVNGSFLPIKLGGAEAVIGVTSGSIPAATYGSGEITPGFGTMDVYDWNADGTKLVITIDSVRVANIAIGAVIASGTKIMCKMLGKVYVVDWELCT